MSYVCVDCGGRIDVETNMVLADGPHHGTGECDYSPYERHEMPNGDVVYYLDSTHTYHSNVTFKGGKWVGQGRWGDLPSPSSIAKFADPSADNLMDWAARKQVEGVFRLGTLDSFTCSEDVLAALKKHKLTWRDLRDSAGDVGTLVHDAFECLLAGQIPEELPEVDEPALGHVKSLIAFFNDHPALETLQTEQVVYSKEHGFAGRFDARVSYPAPTYKGTPVLDDEKWLIDLKTSKYIGRSYHAQLWGYDLAAEECGIGASDRLLILQTREDGTYTLWPCRSSRSTFLHCLALYRHGKDTDAATRKDWKELAK